MISKIRRFIKIRSLFMVLNDNYIKFCISEEI